MYKVIGDSHVFLFNKTAGYEPLMIGQPTAFNLINPKSRNYSLEQMTAALARIDKQNDIVIISAGEIDCRIHVYYQHKKHQKPIDQLIDGTVIEYGKFLHWLEEMHVKFMVCGIPPAGDQPNFYKVPYYPTPEVQAYIYREFNEKMKHFCEQKKYIYLDVYSKTVGPDGHTLPEFKADVIHLNSKARDIVIEMIALQKIAEDE